MATLMNTWSDYDIALQTILDKLTQSLAVFDENLARLARLEKSDNIEKLRTFLSDRQHTFFLLLRDAEPFRREYPRLMRLLRDFPDNMHVIQTPPHLSTLHDSLVIVDSEHALVRFHDEQPRSKVIVEDSAECRVYVSRFEDLLKEGGEPISATSLGL